MCKRVKVNKLPVTYSHALKHRAYTRNLSIKTAFQIKKLLWYFFVPRAFSMAKGESLWGNLVPRSPTAKGKDPF